MKLPIDVVPDTSPPKFRWRQVVSTPVGDRTVDYEGELPPSVEVAVALLVSIVKQLALDNADLREQIKKAEEAELVYDAATRSKREEQKQKLLSSRKDKGAG